MLSSASTNQQTQSAHPGPVVLKINRLTHPYGSLDLPVIHYFMNSIQKSVETARNVRFLWEEHRPLVFTSCEAVAARRWLAEQLGRSRPQSVKHRVGAVHLENTHIDTAATAASGISRKFFDLLCTKPSERPPWDRSIPKKNPSHFCGRNRRPTQDLYNWSLSNTSGIDLHVMGW